MEKQTPKDCTCACDAELAKLQNQLRAAQKMVESGYQDTSLVSKIQNKINKLQNKLSECSKAK